ncbi:MAG: lipocalin family protein [Prevotellaceae bacterium]|nr:lipocalin family protein [Prevotellaceae bacterium]
MCCRQLYVLLLPLTAILLAVTSCTSCSDSRRKAGTVNPMVRELDETPDEAEFVRLDRIGADSIHVFSRTKKRNESFAYKEAEANQHIYGTLRVGDIYSVFPETKRQSVSIVINVTQLKGRWIYDSVEFRGIDFNDKGGMSSINTGDICFREWKLLNGRLYIYYVDAQTVADDRHKYEVEEAHILVFDEKRLVLLFKGETYDCSKYIKE